ncbi:GNAT family N-acetyltransferase [Tessaracoccus antarcticus]|uniref:N-acetyltransferase n=1 Tax=Tessaracoccus antarcticus TaxID=2479848 RepID=A0A3M0G9R0_9ACTN|nr:GNAT family protein [Tessaracoccus antarcticus]RMB61771.1 N-acetyltransferase [Tessaracoccus antarcticus]
MQILTPEILTGQLVRLEPLSDEHVEGLRVAVQDGRIADLWYTSAPRPEAMAHDVEAKLDQAAQGLMLPFAIRRLADDRLIGVTTYCHPIPAVPAVEIGYTWQAGSAHRTGTNTEAKLLMLSHAFEEWGCRRVSFRATWFNHPSRRAIERLGASFEGRIRNDRILRTGEVTDTAQYSITDGDWFAVRHHLRHLIASNTTSAS